MRALLREVSIGPSACTKLLHRVAVVINFECKLPNSTNILARKLF